MFICKVSNPNPNPNPNPIKFDNDRDNWKKQGSGPDITTSVISASQVFMDTQDDEHSTGAIAISVSFRFVSMKDRVVNDELVRFFMLTSLSFRFL